MRRRSLIAAITLGVVIFLAISALLARAFSAGGAQNAAITNLVTAEAHGDTDSVMSLISGCRAHVACRRRAATNVSALRHPGGVSIIEIQGTPSFSVASTAGVARVAWLAGDSLPRVQCVRIRQDGTVLAGFTVKLEEVSVRIRSNADCPRSF